MAKLRCSNCEEKKLKLCQNSKTEIMTKLLYSNYDKPQRRCLFFQKISEHCVNTRPWGPRRPYRGLYRRAASLLGWKSSLPQLFLGGNFINIFQKDLYDPKTC